MIQTPNQALTQLTLLTVQKQTRTHLQRFYLIRSLSGYETVETNMRSFDHNWNKACAQQKVFENKTAF